jgi:predicted ArsR family transcriptional regulator
MSAEPKALSRADLLKQLRKTFPKGVARAQALLKEQKHIQDEISRVLREKPASVPEVAAAVGIPPQQALWYLAAMRKYNLVIENGMARDYPLYQLVEQPA